MSLRLLSTLGCLGALLAAPRAGQSAILLQSGGDAGLRVVVTDFAGPDRTLGAFIGQAVITELGQAEAVTVVDRADYQAALPAGRPGAPALSLTTGQVRALCARLHADRVVTGTYLAHEDEVLVVGRVLDGATGERLTGQSANVAGSSHSLISLAKELCSKLQPFIGQVAPLGVAPTAPQTVAAPKLEPLRPKPAVKAPALDGPVIPSGAGEDVALSEADLVGLVKRLARHVTSPNPAGLAVQHVPGPVTRLRTVSALAKVAASNESLRGFRETPSDKRLPDDSEIPSWAKPYVDIAVEEGWLMADEPLAGKQTATWGFVAMMVERMSLDEGGAVPIQGGEGRPARVPRDAYTGLVIDATGLDLQRTMSPRILDEDGNVLYPLQDAIPGFDYLEDHGMAAYCEGMDHTERAGARPLVVDALRVSGPGRDDLVVSNDVADQIREANRKGRFLRRWAVCIVSLRG